MRNIRFKASPSFIRTTDPNDIMFDFLGSEARNCSTSSAIIFNTFDELEHEALEAISSMFPNIYTTGPLALLSRHVPESGVKSLRSSLWKEDSECLEWLDKQEPSSVVYVNYGSITLMTEEHWKEFAWGLANSKHSFLWIVRPDVVMETDSAILPEEYFEEIKDIGLTVDWFYQQKVLSHPAVAVFLNTLWVEFYYLKHKRRCTCTLLAFLHEATNNLSICMPTWHIGTEDDCDLKRGDIENLVKEMLEGEEGKKMKENALEWKNKPLATTDIGGKSYKNFDRFIKEALYHSN